MDVHIPDDLAEELQKKAAASGSDPADLAVLAIRRTLSSDQRLEELLRPTREAFHASGMTEDEAVELFEAEKHLMRQERSSSTRQISLESGI